MLHDIVDEPLWERASGAGPLAPVPIMQREWEFNKLLELYCIRAPSSVLELGCGHGGTTYWWMREAPLGARIIVVDTFEMSPEAETRLFDWKPEGVELMVIKGQSNDQTIVNGLRDFAPFDWIFIDAGHLYEQARADWEYYRRMAAPNGIIVFHDIYEGQPGVEVHRLWEEIQAQGYITQELVTTQPLTVKPEGLGIGIVYL